MANPEHLAILKQGVEVWNAWRAEDPEVRPDLSEADLRNEHLKKANLSGADLSRADLSGAILIQAHVSQADFSDTDLGEANLSGADFTAADLRRAYICGATLLRTRLTQARLGGAVLSGANLLQANLSGANLVRTDLSGTHTRDANLSGACLSRANLSGAIFFRANLSRADLTQADLRWAVLIQANLQEAQILGCRVYGASVWGADLRGATQQDLIITNEGEPVITVDNLEVAQFMYLLLHNEKIRDVIDTITSKVVLILGRFTPERKAVLDAIRDALRKHNYLPVMFDFDKPASRDFTETVTTLARLSRFIIADFTGQRSLPHEIASIVPDLRSVPIQPIVAKRHREYGMFEDFRVYPIGHKLRICTTCQI